MLYDVSSSYVEGRCCEQARFGYNRDRKKGKLQIVYGLLRAADGCPVTVEMFEGNTGTRKWRPSKRLKRAAERATSAPRRGNAFSGR